MMKGFYLDLLLMSIVATALYLVLKLFIKWTQKHFTTSWLYYSHVLLSTFFLIPFYKLFTYLDNHLSQTVNHSLDTNTISTPIRTVVQNSIASLNRQEGSYITNHGVSNSVSYLFGLLPYVLLTGTFVFIAVILFQNLKFHRRMLKICERTDDPLIVNELEWCTQKLGIKKDIQVYLSPYISTPFLYGIFKPRIVLAVTLDFSQEQYRQIFLHELTHSKRYDILLKFLLIFINSLHWFNPFAYLARRDIDRYCELSCDEKIVQHMSNEERKRYCELVLNVLWNVVNQKDGLYSAFSGNRKYLEKRINMIWRSEDKNSKKSFRIFAAVLLLFVAWVGSVFAYSGSQSESNRVEDYPSSSSTKAGTYVPDESIILKGEVGTTIRKGDLIFERIESDSPSFPEKVDVILANTSQTHLIKNSEEDENCTIWIRNAGSGHIIFTITKGSGTGAVVPGSIVRIPAHTTWTISTIKPWKAKEYYVNFTSGKVIMSGQVAVTLTKV